MLEYLQDIGDLLCLLLDTNILRCDFEGYERHPRHLCDTQHSPATVQRENANAFELRSRSSQPMSVIVRRCTVFGAVLVAVFTKFRIGERFALFGFFVSPYSLRAKCEDAVPLFKNGFPLISAKN